MANELKRLQVLQQRIDQDAARAARLGQPLPDPGHMSDREMLNVLGMEYQHEVIDAIARRHNLPAGMCWATLCPLVSPLRETALYYSEWFNRFA